MAASPPSSVGRLNDRATGRGYDVRVRTKIDNQPGGTPTGGPADIGGERVAELELALERLRHTHEKTIHRLAEAVEARDAETGGHIERIGECSALLAAGLGLPSERIELIRLAAPLHDVGKVAIADAVLLKPGPLSDQERSAMEAHTEIGHRLLDGSETSLLDLAATIALTHHERFEGSGYPRRLQGEEIPLEGRIVAVVDVFDALVSSRPYRDALPLEKSVGIMLRERGKHFDPEILDVFLDRLDSVLSAIKKTADIEPVLTLQGRA